MGQAFLYGTGGGGTGGILTVTAPAGVTVTISKDGKVKTKVADSSGVATFKGLKAGTWTVTISDDSETATATVEIVTDYAKTMTFFAATIAVTYPEGGICTCTDGKIVLTAPDTSGSCTFTVHDAGEWTVRYTDGDYAASETVTISASGQNASVALRYYIIQKGIQNAAFTRRNSGNLEYTQNEDNLCVNGKQSGYHWLGFDNVDLTKFSTMVLEGTFDNQGYTNINQGLIMAVVVNGADVILGANAKGYVVLTESTGATLDISELTGVYTAGFRLPYIIKQYITNWYLA